MKNFYALKKKRRVFMAVSKPNRVLYGKPLGRDWRAVCSSIQILLLFNVHKNSPSKEKTPANWHVSVFEDVLSSSVTCITND